MTDPAYLGSMLAHLQDFRVLHETEGISFLTGPGGETWSLADMDRLAALAPLFLPACQAGAVEAAIAGLDPLPCLPSAVSSLSRLYDMEGIWRETHGPVRDITGVRWQPDPCPGHQSEAA